MTTKKTLVVIVLALALFLRLYRTSDFLGFWYDQGRDAKVIWDFIHDGKMFMIGPTTGIEGIFLGPFYYYFISPFYFLSGGDPVLPAKWLGLLSFAGVCVGFLIARKYFSGTVAILGVILLGLSYEMVTYSRWLSNPNPLPLFSLLAFSQILSIIHSGKSKLSWLLLGLVLGLCLQFEAASAIFFIPSTLLIMFVFRKSISFTLTKVGLAILMFFVTLSPQLIFNFRHQNIILNSFIRFLFAEKSFQPIPTGIYLKRIIDYFNFAFSKLSPGIDLRPFFAVVTLLLLIFVIKKRIMPVKPTVSLFIWITVPAAFLLFYHGNKGYVWDYYFIGAYSQLLILTAAIWGYAFTHLKLTKPLVLVIISVFLYLNVYEHLVFFQRKLPGYISLTPIIQSVDWVYEDAKKQPFNVDVYVPPIISHAYDYVFRWRGTRIYSTLPAQNQVEKLYTLLEPDGEHPQLRLLWLVRQEQIGSLEKETSFGPILVQKRHRLTIGSHL